MEPKDLFVLRRPSPAKLQPRSVGQLRVETAQLQQEHRDMEQRLQQLRVAMSREKEERKKLGAFRWKSARAGSVTGASRGHADSKENNSHKLPSGRVRVRLLKQEPPEQPRRAAAKPLRPPLVPGNVASDRKSRLKGKPCGQCETRAAGLMCAECGEDYCVGCFARFHQKGALKHHRMIPMKMEIHTSISTLDVLGRFRRQIDADETSAPLWEGGVARSAAPSEAPVRVQSAEVSAQEDEADVRQEERAHLGGRSATLLSGDFDEEESARSFREALQRWRQEGERPGGPEEVLPVSKECAATQANLTLRRLAVQVEFQECGLSYMERLLVKKHRRSPIEQHRPSLHSSWLTDDERPALTAEDMEMKRYCASLFSAPAAGGHSQHEGPAQQSPSFEETVDGDMAGGPKPTTSSAVDWGAQSKDAHEAQELDAAAPITVDSRDPPDPSQTRMTDSPELDLSFRVRSPKTCLSSKTSATQSTEPDLSNWIKMTQTQEPDMSSRSPVSQSSEAALSSRTPLTQSPEPDLSIRTQMVHSPEPLMSSKTSVTQSTEPDMSSRSPVSQSPEAALSSRTPLTQSPEPDLSIRTQMVHSPEPLMSSKTSVTQSTEPDMSSRSPVSQSPEAALSSRTPLTQSPEPDLSIRTQMVHSPEPLMSSKTSVTQSTEPDMSSRSPVNQSPEAALSSRTPLTQSPEPDLSFRTQMARSPEVARFSVTRMNHSPQPDLSFKTAVTQSAEPSLSPWTQMARSPEPDLPSGCTTLRSPRVGQISAKFPCPRPPVTAPCGPSRSPRLPPRLRSAPALRSSFSAGESSFGPGASFSGSLCPGGAGERSPDPASSPAPGHHSDLASGSESDAGAGMNGEPSEELPDSPEALCSLSHGELTRPHRNPGLVPIAVDPCGPVDPAAGTGSGWQLMGRDGLHTSQPLPTSFSPPVSLPLYPGLPSRSLSLSLSPSPPESPSVSSSLSLPPSRAFVSLCFPPASPPITPPLCLSVLRPYSPPLTPPLSQDFRGADPALSEEPFLEEDAERLALARLEEELRRMSTEPPSPSLGRDLA